MATHSFHSTPEHASRVQTRHALVSLGMVGVQEGWNAPVARWSAPTGFDSVHAPDNYTHHTFTRQLSAAKVFRAKLGGSVAEENPRIAEQIAIQSAGVDHRFICREPVFFDHIYMSESFIRHAASALYGAAGERSCLLHDSKVFFSAPELAQPTRCTQRGPRAVRRRLGLRWMQEPSF
jgi:hypothetical protein